MLSLRRTLVGVALGLALAGATLGPVAFVAAQQSLSGVCEVGGTLFAPPQDQVFRLVSGCNSIATDLLVNLISWWKLDETSGVRADSVVTSGNDLTDNNTVLAGGGVGSYALALNGSSQYLSMADPFDPPTAFTVSAWVYPTTVAAGDRVIAAHWDVGANKRAWRLMVSAATPTFQMSTLGTGVTVTSATSGNISANQWALLTARWDGANLTLYSDTTAGAPAAFAGPVYDSNVAALVGVNLNSGSPVGYFGGRIQNLAIYNNTDKGAAFVTSMYNSGRGKRYEELTADEKTGLFDFWTLDEASGNRVGEYAGNALAPTNTPGRLAGIVNSAKTSTGANFVLANSESLSRASNATLQTGDIDYTVGCWFNPTTLPATPMALLAKNDGTKIEYQLEVDDSGAGSKVNFYTGTGAAALGVAASVAAPVLGEWNLALGWHDAANSLTYVQLNNAAPVSIADGGDPGVETAVFALGGYTGNFNNGAQEECFLYKRILTEDERTYLYNSGVGRTYSAGGIR